MIADGLYEWKKVGGTIQPYFIRRIDDRPFPLAGLGERWSTPERVIESGRIATTTPNALMADLHDRMPVILPPEAARRWLNPDIDDAGLLRSLLIPYRNGHMVAYPVSTKVNSPNHDAAECILQLDPDSILR